MSAKASTATDAASGGAIVSTDTSGEVLIGGVTDHPGASEPAVSAGSRPVRFARRSNQSAIGTAMKNPHTSTTIERRNAERGQPRGSLTVATTWITSQAAA